VKVPQTAPIRVKRHQVSRSERPGRGRQSRPVQASEPPPARYADGQEPRLKDWNKVASKKRDPSPTREATVESKKPGSIRKESETLTTKSETPVAESRKIRRPRSYTSEPRLPIPPPKTDKEGFTIVQDDDKLRREARKSKKETKKKGKEHFQTVIKPRIEAKKKAQEEAAAKGETKPESPENRTPKSRTPNKKSPKPVVPVPVVEPSASTSAEQSAEDA
jgi:hypothetical protein